MNENSETVKLADVLEQGNYNHYDVMKAAAELRRLSAIGDEWARLSQDEGKADREIERLRAMNRELLEALIELTETGAEAWGEDRPCVRMGLAAIRARSQP
jgi:hypothetical protein